MKRIPKNKKNSRDLKRCAICGIPYAIDNHHIIPKSLDGSDFGLNRVYLCANHHRMVHSGHIIILGWKDLGYKMELDYEIKESIIRS